MKKINLLAFVLTIVILSGCSDDDDVSIDDNSVTISEITLSQQEIDDLKFLREEEKLARDVYLFSYDLYGETIFNNISKSEQQHMDQLLVLLNLYEINDPASTERGVFSNETLQTLYNDLVVQSSISLVEALNVGATIEDLDIKDIEEFEHETANSTILNVYDKLKCGSRNHIRNYTSQLTLNEVNYEPQFISLEKYIEILASLNEKCGKQ